MIADDQARIARIDVGGGVEAVWRLRLEQVRHLGDGALVCVEVAHTEMVTDYPQESIIEQQQTTDCRRSHSGKLQSKYTITQPVSATYCDRGYVTPLVWEQT